MCIQEFKEKLAEAIIVAGMVGIALCMVGIVLEYFQIWSLAN